MTYQRLLYLICFLPFELTDVYFQIIYHADLISCCLHVAPAAVICLRPRLCVAIPNSSHHWYDPPSNSLVLALNSTLTSTSIVRQQPVLVWIKKKTEREEIWNRIEDKRREKKDDLTSCSSCSVGRFPFCQAIIKTSTDFCVTIPEMPPAVFFSLLTSLPSNNKLII